MPLRRLKGYEMSLSFWKSTSYKQALRARTSATWSLICKESFEILHPTSKNAFVLYWAPSSELCSTHNPPLYFSLAPSFLNQPECDTPLRNIYSSFYTLPFCHSKGTKCSQWSIWTTFCFQQHLLLLLEHELLPFLLPEWKAMATGARILWWWAHYKIFDRRLSFCLPRANHWHISLVKLSSLYKLTKPVPRSGSPSDLKYVRLWPWKINYANQFIFFHPHLCQIRIRLLQ